MRSGQAGPISEILQNPRGGFILRNFGESFGGQNTKFSLGDFKVLGDFGSPNLENLPGRLAARSWESPQKSCNTLWGGY